MKSTLVVWSITIHNRMGCNCYTCFGCSKAWDEHHFDGPSTRCARCPKHYCVHGCSYEMAQMYKTDASGELEMCYGCDEDILAEHAEYDKRIACNLLRKTFTEQKNEEGQKLATRALELIKDYQAKHPLVKRKREEESEDEEEAEEEEEEEDVPQPKLAT